MPTGMSNAAQWRNTPRRRIRVLDDQHKALGYHPGFMAQFSGGEMSAPSQVYSDGIAPPGGNAGANKQQRQRALPVAGAGLYR